MSTSGLSDFFFLTKMPQPLLWVDLQATCIDITISGIPNLQNYCATFTVHKLFTNVATGPGWLQDAHPWSNTIHKYTRHFSELNFRVTSEPLVTALLRNCEFTTPTEFQPTQKCPMQYDTMLLCKKCNKLYTIKL
jgi:hypothetical protein